MGETNASQRQHCSGTSNCEIKTGKCLPGKSNLTQALEIKQVVNNLLNLSETLKRDWQRQHQTLILTVTAVEQQHAHRTSRHNSNI